MGIPTRFPAQGSILTILFGFGSGLFFTVLFWFLLRTMTGDSRLIPSLVGVIGGIMVSSYFVVCEHLGNIKNGKEILPEN